MNTSVTVIPTAMDPSCVGDPPNPPPGFRQTSTSRSVDKTGRRPGVTRDASDAAHDPRRPAAMVRQMTVLDRLRRRSLPSLDGVTEWLNGEPLDPTGLHGHVVLVNFWTFTCINWLRTEPYVRTWWQTYRDDGLVVIGVHTPEFSFEHEIDRVRRATTERGIDYPVAVDNDYAIWNAFDNQYWPALYFVDTTGVIRDHHFGEGRYEQSERIIQRLLGVERDLVSVKGSGVEVEADWAQLRTPETYLGYGRSANFASPGGAAFDERARATSSPSACPSTTGLSPVSGRSGSRRLRSGRPEGPSPAGSTPATRTSCCHPGRERRSRSACSSTVKPQATHTA